MRGTLGEILILFESREIMKDLFLNFSIGIVSGTFAGLLSSFLVYLFSEKRNKVRRIIEYAEQTAEKAFQVLDEANEYSEGKSIETLKMLLKKDVRRHFPGDIVDNSEVSQRLQSAIAGCNGAMYKVELSLTSEDISSHLFHASYELNNAVLEIWNATTEYDVTEDTRIEKFKKRVLIGIPVIIFIFVVGIVIGVCL